MRGELGRFGGATGLAELVARWPQAVGEQIARNAWPSRLGRDGTLHANTADAMWAFELAQRGPEIASRLGVPAVRFAPGPLARDDDPQPARGTAPSPTPAELATAAELAAGITAENLRETVQKAVSLSLARNAADRAV